LNRNRVELIGYYGGDKTHALSAWTSTERDILKKEKRIGALLKMLAENGHHTPFEKSTLHFLVTCDTASHIHILKHRIGVSVNGESARYKELKEDKYLVPEDWPEDMQEDFIVEIEKNFSWYHDTIKELERRGFTRKRAKESARFILPYANQLTLDVSFNFRSFMHFQSLRNKDDAQNEIGQIAQDMLELVKATKHFDLSLTGFGYA
jgi:thymidylate synthase (FAD)